LETELNLDPDSNTELITDLDPNLQIIPDPAGTGCTTLEICITKSQIFSWLLDWELNLVRKCILTKLLQKILLKTSLFLSKLIISEVFLLQLFWEAFLSLR
jgi:hypothetical protein